MCKGLRNYCFDILIVSTLYTYLRIEMFILHAGILFRNKSHKHIHSNRQQIFTDYTLFSLRSSKLQNPSAPFTPTERGHTGFIIPQ